MNLVQVDPLDAEPAERGLDLAPESSFSPDRILTLSGSSEAESVYYAAVIPGAVLDQGVVPVKSGKFRLNFDPVLMSHVAPTYDVTNLVRRTPEIRDVVHLTLFSKEIAPDGSAYHSCVRVIIRGNRVFYTR